MTVNYDRAIQDYTRQAEFGELTIKQNSRKNWVPEMGYDDSNAYITVKEATKGTRIDGSHIRWLLARGIIQGTKVNGTWQIKLGSFSKWLEKQYKFREYIDSSNRYGRSWTLDELQLLFTSATNDEIAEMIERSSEAIRMRRCKLGMPHINDEFKNSYFVTPHAIKRYQQRIVKVPAKYAIWNIQDGLQSPKIVEMSRHMGVTYFCKGRYNLLDFRAIVIKEPDREWPSVVTVKEK